MMIIIIRYVSINLFFRVPFRCATEDIIRMFPNLQLNFKFIPLHNAFKTWE